MDTEIGRIRFVDRSRISIHGKLTLHHSQLVFVSDNEETIRHNADEYQITIHEVKADSDLRRIELSKNLESESLYYFGTPEQATDIYHHLEKIREMITDQREKTILANVNGLLKDSEYVLLTDNFMRLYTNEVLTKNRFTDDWALSVEEVKTFSKVLSDKCVFKDMYESLSTARGVLYRRAPIVFAEVFENEHGEHFDNIRDLTLDNCLNIYSHIETININDTANVMLFGYFLIKHEKVDKNNNMQNVYETIISGLEIITEKKQIESFKKKLKTVGNAKKKQTTLFDIDLMTGTEFEKFIAELFTKMGYSCTFTKTSGDQGIDVIAEKGGHRIGIQAKCYSSSVSNSAIQEVAGGIAFYGVNKGMVITNNHFTNSAIQLAAANNVLLWDRKVLAEKIWEFLD